MLTTVSSEKCAFIATVELDDNELADTTVFSRPAELHIWKLATLNADQIDYELFSTAEKQRSAQIKNPTARQVHDASRYLMRKLFASYLQLPPKQLAFDKNASGKPCLLQAGQLQYNLTHSGQAIYLAVTNQGMVGIDLEHVRHDTDWQKIARRLLDPDTVTGIASNADPQHEFTRQWTMFEARQKLLGVGIFGQSADTQAMPGHCYINSWQPDPDSWLSVAWTNPVSADVLRCYEITA